MIGMFIHRWGRRPRVRWSRLSPLIRTGYSLGVASVVGVIATIGIVAMFNAWTAGRNAVASRFGSAGVIVWLAIALIAVPPLFQLAGSTLVLVGQRRFLRRLRAERFTLCPGCGYGLRGSGRTEQCPECGRRFDPKGVIREWGRILPRRGRRWGERLWIRRYAEVRR